MFNFRAKEKVVIPLTLPAAPVPAAAGAAVCQDCGAPIAGNYCANCGQETRIETPTVRQFTHEMMDQYVAVEGKLGRTLRVLITQPGQLTLDYISGRRQRYVRPLKLYVSISVVFFGALGILPDSFSGPFLHPDKDATQQAAKPNQDVNKLPAAPAAVPARQPDMHDLAAEIERDVAAGVKSGGQAKLADTIKGAVDKRVQSSLADRAKAKASAFERLSSAEQREKVRNTLLDDAPYAMFFLLPYFALLLRLLYRKNKQLYGVHLLFSVHLHCFAFLLLLLMLVPWEPWRQGMQWLGAAYVFFALRRVYGGNWWSTAWRMGVVYMLYMLAIGITALSGVLSLVFGGSSA